MSTLKTNNIQHVDRSDPSIIINTDGSVNIAGTMTYEDVTNVDSVGIITARKQLHVGTGVSIAAGGLNVTAGVSTFTAIQASGTAAFTGDVQLGNATSDTITFTGRVNSDLNPSGSTRDLGTSGAEWRTAYLLNGVVASDTIATHSGDSNTKIRFPADNIISLETAGTEAFRVDASKRLLIGEGLTSRAIANITSRQQIETTDGSAALSITRNDNAASASTSRLNFGRSRATSLGGVTAVTTNDILGEIRFSGADGTDLTNHAASISSVVDGSVSSNTVPGRLIFSTATGSDPIERMRITSAGAVQVKGGANGHLQIDNNGEFEIFESDTSHTATNSAKIAMDFDSNVARLRVSGNGSFSQRPLGIFLGASEKLRLDTSARLLIGHTSSVTTNGQGKKIQISGTDFATSGVAQLRYQNDISGASLMLAHSRGGLGNNGILQDDDEFGKIRFIGNDGTDFRCVGAEIVAKVDGTPGENDMPGRLEFGTTPNGGTDATTRMIIDQNGYVKIGTTAADAHHMIKLNTSTTNAIKNVLSIDASVTGGTAADGFGSRLLFGGEHLNGNNYSYGGIAGKLSTTGSTYGHLSFYTNNNGTLAEKMRLTDSSSGELQILGNSATIKTVESGGAIAQMQSGGNQAYFGTPSGNTKAVTFRVAGSQIAHFTTGGDMMLDNQRQTSSGVEPVGQLSFSGPNAAMSNQTDMYRINFFENARSISATRTDNANASIRYNGGTGDGGDGSIRFANENGTRLLYMNRLGNGGTSGSWSVGSDARKKENITTVTDALTKVSQLRGVDFNWRAKWGGHADSGVIAQEVENILPNLVITQEGARDTDDDGNSVVMKHVNYNGLWGVMIEAVKVLITKNEALEARIATLEKSI